MSIMGTVLYNMHSLLLVFILLVHSLVNSHYVNTSFGVIRGRIVQGKNLRKASVFLGVPYAKPPIGQWRYREPQSASSWNGVLQATKYRPACMSNTSQTTSPQSFIDEDCLYINIFVDDRCTTGTTNDHQNQPCPVIIYLHGGGFLYDSATMFPIQTLVDNFATKQVVFVTNGVRLGSFGFMDLGNDELITRNLGFHDMVKVMEWIGKEIGHFGGDPNRVTLMGHSSGATAASLLTLSPNEHVNQLFQKAIVMSGPPKIEKNANVKVSFRLAQRAQCVSNKEKFIKSVVNCLRSKKASDLLDWQRELEDEHGLIFIGPSNDEKLFPNSVAFMRDHRKPMPYLTGTTAIEFTTFVNKNQTRLMAYQKACEYLTKRRMFEHVEGVVDECIKHYLRTDIEPSRFESEAMYIEAFEDAASLRDKKATVFLYSFDYMKRAKHASDLTFVVGIHPFEQNENDKKLAKLYPAYLVDFAREKLETNSDWLPMTNPNGFNYYSIDYNGEKRRPHNENFYHLSTVEFWLSKAIGVEAGIEFDIRKEKKVDYNQELMKQNELLELEQGHSKNTSYGNWELAFWIITSSSIVLLLIIGMHHLFGYLQRNSTISHDCENSDENSVLLKNDSRQIF